MEKLNFQDSNTQKLWSPLTGGSNLPALNDLLNPFEIALGNRILQGWFEFQDSTMYYASGASIAAFPSGGHIVSYQNLFNLRLTYCNWFLLV